MLYSRRVIAFLLGVLFLTSSFANTAARLDRPADLVSRVIALIDARLALMPDVAAAKWIAHMPVTDAAREKAVIAAAGDAADLRGLAREPVEALFALQVETARSSQEALIATWQQQGAGPTEAPSLTGSLRPALDRITADLIDALIRAAPYLASATPKTLREGFSNERWNETQRARLASTLTEIRLASERSVDRARKTGVLRIGVPADYAPFAWEDHGELVGADIELSQRLAEQLQLTPVYVRSSWSSLLADLESDRFDLALGGISITPARQARATFSIALVGGGKTALGRCSDKSRLGSLEQINRPGIRVIENPGGTNEAFARRHLTQASLTIHKDNISVFNELLIEQADVMFTDDLEIARVTRQEPRLCRLFDTVFEPTDKAVLLPLNPQWKELVDAIVAPTVSRGDYQRWLDAATAR